MCLPSAFKDRDSHIDLPKGCQTLNGVEALTNLDAPERLTRLRVTRVP